MNINKSKMREDLLTALAKPTIIFDEVVTDEYFNPWVDVIKGINGSYSSGMDDLFINAMKAIRDKKTFDFIDLEGKAGEMALYVLSGHGMTDYGTSPRGGWPAYEISDLWQPLIDKWQAYHDVDTAG